MANDIKKLLNSLNQTRINLNIGKNTLSEILDEVGYQIELVDKQKKLWSELDKQGTVPKPITASGYNMAQSLVQNSQEIVTYVDTSNLRQTINFTASLNAAIAGTAIAGATISYPPNQLPQSYFELDKVVDQRTNRVGISQRIRLVNTNLANEYDNAWSGLHSTSTDQTRSPMFLMREVVTQLINYYAPDSDVRNFYALASADRTTRRQRVQYITSLIQDPLVKQGFMDQEQALLDVYDALSKAHSPTHLSSEQTKGYLYQANELIKLLLDST